VPHSTPELSVDARWTWMITIPDPEKINFWEVADGLISGLQRGFIGTDMHGETVLFMRVLLLFPGR
jgi:hypothetical protein